MIEVSDLNRMVPPEVFGVLSEEAVQTLVADIAEKAQEEWIRVAGAALHTSRRDYLDGIQPVVGNGSVATISLVGMIPNLIEPGMSEVDLHDTLLGPKVPVAPKGQRGKRQRFRRNDDGTLSADGYFRAIPFRQATPGTKGAAGAAMGSPFGENASKLGKAVYELAKGLKGSTSQPGGPTKWGDRLKEGLVPKLKEYHATDIYAGMVKLEKTYRKGPQSQYATFRTISVDGTGKGVGSSPWIRPSTPGKGFAKQVSEYVGQIAPMAFETYAKGISGG